MLKSYLRIALRSLFRHKGYTFINISGLALGIACCLLILLYVRDELSYDRHHAHADRIYRVTMALGDRDLVVTPTIVGPLFKRTFAEVETTARLYDVGSFRPVVVRHGEHVFQEERFFYADSTVFDVFTLPFVAGSPEAALNRPATIVLTRSMARKYFGDEDPVGQTLQIGSDATYEVTGVLEDLPATSHVQFDFLASFATLGWSQREIWGSANFLTYLLLRDARSRATLETKITAYLDQVRAQGGELPDAFRLVLEPLTRIHLYVDGRITYVYLFAAVALLILLIACINYTNLATARSAGRAKEVGIRKMSGARRAQLVGQFFGESALTTLVATLLALALAWLLLPAFNGLSGKQLTLTQEPALLVLLGVLGAGVGLVAGSYPALLLSSFQPVRALKGTFRTGTAGSRLRRGLVVFQFAASVVLIVGTLVVYRQLDFVRQADLGFTGEQVVALPLGDRQLQDTYPALKRAVLQQPNVLQAAAVNSIPGYQRGGYSLQAEGLELPPGESFLMGGVPADRDVVETLDLALVAGPGFPPSDAYTPEQGYVYLINEATARALGWTPEEAVGKWFDLQVGRRGEVMGVVKDFHYASLHEPIEPLAFFIEPDSYEHLLVKIAPGDVPGTLAALRQVWERLAPHRPFDYAFLDQEFDALYRADVRLGQLSGSFALLAVLIACLGLFGLASFMAEQRTKEIGVRKVLGASVPQIVLLFSKDFTLLVLAGFVLAVPVAYAAMHRWLEDFAYRVDIGVGTFLATAGLVLLIAWLSVAYQSVRAALADPVDALRYE